MLQCVEILRGFFFFFFAVLDCVRGVVESDEPDVTLLASFICYFHVQRAAPGWARAVRWCGPWESGSCTIFFNIFIEKHTKKKSEWELEEKFRVLRGLSRMLEIVRCCCCCSEREIRLSGSDMHTLRVNFHWKNKLLLSGTWEVLRYFYFSSSDPWSAHRITQEISEILLKVRALFGWPMTCEFFLVNCLFGHSTANFIQVFQSSQQNAKKIVEIIYALDTRVCV